MKKIILVTGATGAQGGSVARALLAENKFAVRILTRNALNEKAIALKRVGAEIVEGNMDDIDSLKAAMKDCYGVFGVTSFWEHYEKEFQQGKNLIDAVAQSGIKHFVFSSLPDYHQLSNGKYSVPHCDMKAALQRYTESLQIPSSFVQITFYYENFLYFFPLQNDHNGGYFFGFPQGNTKLASVSVEDYGPVVAAVFNNPAIYMGQTINTTGADKTCEEYAAILGAVLRRNVYFKYIPRDEYAALAFPGAEELANMFEVQRLHIPNREKDLQESKKLNPGIQSFESWVIRSRNKIEATIAPKKQVVY